MVVCFGVAGHRLFRAAITDAGLMVAYFADNVRCLLLRLGLLLLTAADKQETRNKKQKRAT